MKRLLILLCFGIICSIAGYAPDNNTLTITNAPIISPFKPLWEASRMVESSGDNNALNQLELAFGVVQIRMIRIRDYNQRTGKSYTLKDCYNEQISKEVWFYYASKFHPSDYESVAKSWNGRGKSNRVYWDKIKKQLEMQ